MAKVQHTCTGCVPIDASIIDVYIQLLGLKDSTTAAAERAEYAAEHAIGKSPYIGANGDWWEWSDERGEFIDTMVQAQGSIAVDTHMDPNSTNPVQNKVVTEAINAKYTKPATGIPDSDLASGVIPDVSQFITASVNNLVNYYLKSETYTKSEVQEMIGAIQGFSYEVVASLPTASASTKGKIYLVPSSDPQTQNVKDEYITIDNGASANPRYTWEQIGSTAVDLDGYVTTADLNTALAGYTTTANLTTLLAGKQDVIQDLTTIRSGAAAGATAYQKPGTGIPASDLASGVIPTVPTISTDVSADAASDVKTSSPKSVKTYVDAGIAAVESDLADLADEVEAIDIGAYVVAWDGESSPVVANIPAGVVVTYGGTDYTGTLAASASTIQKIYLVATGTTDNYDRYITVGDSTYSWVNIGTTEITLADYATKTEVSQLEQEVNGQSASTEEIVATDTQTKSHLKYDGTIISGSAVESVVRTYPAVAGAKYKVDGRVGSIADTCLAVFLDGNNVALAHYNDTTGTSTPYQNVELIAPVGSVTLKVAGNTGGANPYNTKVIRVIDSVEGLRPKVETLSTYVGDGGMETPLPESVVYNSQYVDNANGELVTGTSGSKTYEFQGIFPGKKYKITGRVGANASTCLVAYYDGAGNYLSCEIPSSGTGQAYEDYLATIPEGCRMLRILGYFPTTQSQWVVPAVVESYTITDFLDEVAKETEKNNALTNKKNTGKSIVVLGGSHTARENSEVAKDIWRDLLALKVFTAGVGSCGITAGITMYGWTYNGVSYYTRGGFDDAIGNRVWDELGYLSELTTTAKSDSSITLSDGNTYARDTAKDYFCNAQTKVSRLLAKSAIDKDIYLVWLSTNDYRQILPLGSYSDYTELDNYDVTKVWTDEQNIGTVCGGFNFIIKTIRDNKPTAEIYLFTSIRYFNEGARGYDPWTSNHNESGMSFYGFQQEIMKAAQVAGCAILDQFMLQGVGKDNYPSFYESDRLHMNPAGYERIGWIQEEFLENGK